MYELKYYKLIKELPNYKEYEIGKIYPFKSFCIMMNSYWEKVREVDYYRQQRNRLQIIATGTQGTLFSDAFVLSKNWYTKITRENFNIIKEWFITKIHNINILEYPENEYIYIGILKTTNEIGITDDKSFFDIKGEISFENFVKYVIDMDNCEKVLEEPIAIAGVEIRGIIGYKLKYPEYKGAINKILGFAFNQEGFENDIKSYPGTIAKLNYAKVLDIWFEPVLGLKETVLYFGYVKFTLKKGNDYADTVHGKIPMFDIKKAIDYIENPPKLGDYELHIHSSAGNHDSIKNIGEGKWKHMFIGFSCKKGTLNELKTIYKAYCNLNDINL